MWSLGSVSLDVWLEYHRKEYTVGQEEPETEQPHRCKSTCCKNSPTYITMVPTSESEN